MEKQLKQGVAGVLGVSSQDVSVRKYTQATAGLTAHISINQVRGMAGRAW